VSPLLVYERKKKDYLINKFKNKNDKNIIDILVCMVQEAIDV